MWIWYFGGNDREKQKSLSFTGYLVADGGCSSKLRHLTLILCKLDSGGISYVVALHMHESIRLERERPAQGGRASSPSSFLADFTEHEWWLHSAYEKSSIIRNHSVLRCVPVCIMKGASSHDIKIIRMFGPQYRPRFNNTCQDGAPFICKSAH